MLKFLFFFLFFFTHSLSISQTIDINSLIKVYHTDTKIASDYIIQYSQKNKISIENLRLLENSNNLHTLNNTQIQKLYSDYARAVFYLSNNQDQLQWALNQHAQTPFSILDQEEWFFLCQRTLKKDFQLNVLPCFERLMTDPSFFVKQSFSSDFANAKTSALFLLFSMPEENWIRKIQDDFWINNTSPFSQQIRLEALFYSTSLRSDAFINQAFDDKSFSYLHDSVAQILFKMHQFESAAFKSTYHTFLKELNLNPEITELELRSLRQEIASKPPNKTTLTQFEKISFLIRAKALKRWSYN